jgi:hypothetical protein
MLKILLENLQIRIYIYVSVDEPMKADEIVTMAEGRRTWLDQDSMGSMTWLGTACVKWISTRRRIFNNNSYQDK